MEEKRIIRTQSRRKGNPSKTSSEGVSKLAHLQSGVFVTGYFQEGPDTAYTGRDPTPDLKSGSAK